MGSPNLGSALGIGTGALAHSIARMAGFRGDIASDRGRPNGQTRPNLNATRAECEIGFAAKMSFDEVLGGGVELYERFGASSGYRFPEAEPAQVEAWRCVSGCRQVRARKPIDWGEPEA